MKDIRKVHFIKEYFGIHRPNDFPKKAYERLSFHFPDLTLNEVRNAAKLAYQEQENYRKKVIDKGSEIIAKAEKRAKRFLFLQADHIILIPKLTTESTDLSQALMLQSSAKMLFLRELNISGLMFSTSGHTTQDFMRRQNMLQQERTWSLFSLYPSAAVLMRLQPMR